MKGLLFKSIAAFFSIAFISFYLSYVYTNYNQKTAITTELNDIRLQGNQALDIVLEHRVDELTLFAEEFFLLEKNNAKQQISSFDYFKSIWPKIRINRSLTSLYISSTQNLLLGKPLPKFLISQAHNAKENLQPYHQIYCASFCEMAVSIPLLIDGKTASLTFVSELFPSIVYSSKSLHIDIGLINQTPAFTHTYISENYPFEALTNITNHSHTLAQLTQQKIDLATIVKGYLHYNKLTNRQYYLWGKTTGHKENKVTFIFFKDVTLTMSNYETQKQSILFHSAAISFGIIIVIVLLVYFPLKKLRLLTEVIEKIGSKNYTEAKEILGTPENTKNSDELHTLSFAMYEALHRIEGYENKIISNQKEFKQQAIIDSLTKLFNRNAFIQDLTELEEYPQNNKTALALIDLDGFKPVNDNLGHEAGDEVLKQVGKRLNKISTDNIIAYRLGGDEFVICIKEEINDETLYNELVSLFNDDFLISGTKVKITASIGIAIGDLTHSSHSELLRHADIAMYEAKKLGKNRFCVFAAEMMEYSNLRFTITNDFLNALNNDEIYLNFQPIVDTQTQKVMKVEALSRWKHPQVGFIRPDVFISIIEGTSYIHDLSYWLIKQCILQLVAFRDNGFDDIVISINISAAQIYDTSSVKFIKTECDKHGIPYHLVELEITETSLIANINAAKNWVNDAQRTGFKVSIDDFGTGYSSLSYLTLFSFDTVKIDRSLINKIPEDLNQQKIVKSIVKMLKELEAAVVIEGIEREEQFNAIKELSADMIQGYYFYRPLGQVELYKVLNKANS